MNLSAAETDPTKYSLFAATSHEIDEVLGFDSAMNSLYNGDPPPTGPISPEDMFRYDQNGNRSFNTAVGAASYFSLDGATDLARFNQYQGGDFHDWYSYYGGQTPKVQDAYSTAGAAAVLGVELRVLDVIGFNRVPFAIIGSAGGGGTVSPGGSFTKTAGDSQTFTASPNANYFVNQWLLDAGAVQTGGTSYTLSNIQASHSVQVTFTYVQPTKLDQTINFPALANKTYADPPFSVTATASSGLPVAFSIASGPATTSGSTVTITGPGTVVVRASQVGNASYNAAPDVDQTFTVAKANQIITFNPLPNKAIGEPPFMVNATASSGLRVGFNLLSGPVAISGNTLTLTSTGTVVVRASQSGDADYNAAPTVNQTFTVSPAPTLSASRLGQNVLITWATNVGGFALETATNLAPVVSWTQVTLSPAVVNGQNTVTNAVSGTQRFYRLKK